MNSQTRDGRRSWDLTKESILFSFPSALRKDPSALALADITADILEKRQEEIDRLSLYPNIDQMPEELLDILAHDFKVDWWDYNYSLEEKRRTLKDSWNVHRRLGTRWAVETALGNVFPGAIIQEWFEYDGQPYCFRVILPVPEEGVSAEKQSRVLSRVWFYKNLRSHLDGLELEAETTGALHLAAFGEAGTTLEVWPELKTAVTMPDAEIKVGAAGGVHETLRVWPELARSIEATAQVGTGAAGQAAAREKVWPSLAEQVEATAPVGVLSAGQTAHSAKVWPELTESVEGTARVGAGSATQQESVTRVWTGVKEHVETKSGASGAWMEINQIVEIYPEE